MREAQRLLSGGLAIGYAGGSVRKGVDRGGFKVETSHVELEEGTYHDEWAADRLGGGQELVRTRDGEIFTRLYAGGTISQEELRRLRISKKMVTDYLKGKLSELKDATRLDRYCLPKPDGYWQYRYELTGINFREIPVKVGIETISFKGQLVFAHFFLLSPVE
ncbi:MAG: hypothetical protein A3C30_00020 [Candidatus Levybacteria bacterium RIFCSPHIGHO2_02_FULL_40_18]|nr:MAG: hypothetical protein A2869_03715 [Candidatus Levybacteria bacterium RIFCSPHIGHO2_01_FULL_40_58]OGH27095.1 MAG: hypothetical protein A3C30_00020 [Candidatus Levybacteria bacterium RIFCSPHIGHO2_02_FULL_40_18]OGH30954.1 MAG: hypothetical protein A3E43_04435 [Candidatus Levybacteria bacterium RIFCSPHIGHO2_12_FULL_40_31]OGH40965.1 MAG: hypothetical protein A2894_01650 [Candidatus Levybacteria bacterium RIFCSPLOWO2_01_FULL_40_64]OGH48958.1 MAG: hypothetical protein A3I54_02905 [Candidatus Lev